MKSLVLIIAVLAAILLPVTAYAADGQASVNLPTDTLKTISLGGEHALAVKADGSVWAWGNDDWGQLGDGASISKALPVKVMEGVTAVSAGSMHSLALKADGSLWAWGNNGEGALGDGTTTDRYTPFKIMDNVRTMSAGNGCSYAVKTDGSLWAWGSNVNKNLGDGTDVKSLKPIKIMDGVTDVDATLSHSVHVIKTDGSLWAWGSNKDGWLGIKTDEDPGVPIQVMDGVSAVSANLLIKTDGSVWELTPADPVIQPNGGKVWQYQPEKIFDKGISVAANWDWYSLAVNSAGDLYVWIQPGFKNSSADISRGITDYMKFAGNVAETASGANAGMFVKNDGSLWAWGENQFGQLGTGKSGGSNAYDEGIDEETPVKILDGVMLPGKPEPVNPTPAVSPALPPGSATVIEFGINSTQYTKNGVQDSFDVAPYIDTLSNRTMVPIYFIAQALGAKVVWDDNAKTDNISLNGKTLSVALNQPLPNGMGTVVLLQDRLFVPIRFISEQLGATVEWDSVKMLVSIKM